MVKGLNPDVQTVYIKPVSKRNVGKMVEFADVSLNSELETIRWISEEAVRQGKKHKIIIMVETGDLREGVMGEQLLDFYSQVFNLPNIEVIGLGTNLNCLNGVMPSTDKLIQLALYKQIIELKFNKKNRMGIRRYFRDYSFDVHPTTTEGYQSLPNWGDALFRSGSFRGKSN